MLTSPRSPRLAAAIVAAVALSALSCGREPTGPGGYGGVRWSHGIAFNPEFPSGFSEYQRSAQSVPNGSGSLVTFSRVRIVLRFADGAVALDTIVNFPAGSDELPVGLNIPLPANAPSGGVPLSMSLKYVNAAGDTVFSGGPVTVTAVPATPGAPAPPPSRVNVPLSYTGPGAATATQVRISPRTLTANTGQPLAFTAQAFDAIGNVVTGVPILFTSDNPLIASINPATGTGSAGASRGTVNIVAQLLTGPTDVSVVTVVAPPANLAAVSGTGQNGPVNSTLAQPVVVVATATDGQPAPGVTVIFAAANGGTVGSASVTTGANGQASTTWRLGAGPGTQTLTASASGLSGSPVTFTATARAIDPVRLEFLQQPPASAAAGTPMVPAVSVRAVDAAGALTTSYTGTVTVTLGAGPAGSVLAGTASVAAVGGIATFPGLALNVPGTYSLNAAATGLAGATSASFQVVAGAANRLIFDRYPVTGATAGAVLDLITVVVRDVLGNPQTTFTGPVTLTLNGPGVAAALDTAGIGSTSDVLITGPVTVNAVAGVATFSNLQINGAGNYTLTATSAGLTSATGPRFSIAAGAPSSLVLVSGAGQSAAGAATLASPVVVRATDAFGNGVAGVTVNFAPAAGSGSVVPTSVVTGTSGNAQTTWTLGGAAGAMTLNASATGLTPNPLAVGATATAAAGGIATQLVFTTGPTSVTAGTVMPNLVVTAKDALGATVTTFTGFVNISINTNAAGAIIWNGTTGVSAVAGVATFSGVEIQKAAAGLTLNASSGTLQGTSAAFTISAAAANQIVADSGGAQSAAFNTALAAKLVARVTDAYNNPVTGTTVVWTVASGGGSLNNTTTLTDANGRVRTNWTLGAPLGAQTVTASSGTLSGSPLTFSATATGGAIATTAYATQLDSLYSFGDTLRRVPVSRDGANAVVAGVYTFVSRTPATATVSGTGLITAVADGSTYIVATENGGTKDSTLIVVKQRVATINVTPGNRNIYRTRTFQFSATAVDGRGNAMAGAPITWSTVAPSVATVDAAGLVTAVALGGTQVRATAGAIVGVATVNVLTPITRIIVGRDSSGTPVTDTTALASLGIRRSMRAEARDTLDAPMTGVTFTWASTNPTVALVDSSFATRAVALSNANGITTFQASAEGVTGSATVKVQQALASIELTPTPDTIGVTAQKQLTARGKDANNRFISGGVFAFSSNNTPVATVNATTGVVTGVSLGTANVTATSGAIRSNAAVIVVASTVPPIISFGRDTLTVGRGASTSIPIFLSRPHGTNVTVNLSALDTVAYFSVGSLTFTPGQTALNVTLNGRNAGTTSLFALDGSGTGFKGDTATVAVQANVRFAQTGWSLNATDQVSTQVLLSDPSPAGGTFVTYTYGTAGRAQVSPDPAFIPAGQLASNVVITALGSTTGSTTIMPVATGVNGTASTLNVSAPVLTISAGASARLGTGQFEGGWYVYTPQTNSIAVPLTYTSTDTTIITVNPTTGAIPGGSYYQYFTVSAKATGTAKVVISATGWKPDTLSMTVTSPNVTLSGQTSFNTTSPQTTLTVYVRDSVGTSHYRTSSLALSVSSSDTNVIKVIDTSPTIAAGQYYESGIRYQPGGMGGTAYVKVTAGGHRPDSMLVTVVGPKLQFSWNTGQLGVGQYDDNVYVYTPNNVTSPLPVTLTSSNPAKATITSSVTVPTGLYYAYLTVTGLDTGVVTLIATAPGYQPDTATYRVSTPRVTGIGVATYNNFRPSFNITAYVRDSANTAHNRVSPLVVSWRSTDTNVVKIDSASVTIGTGIYYNSAARLAVRGLGTAYVVVSAPGHRPDSSLVTVVMPKLNFSWTTVNLGRRQYFSPTDHYVYTPDNQTAPLSVTITQKNAAVDSLAATALTIPTGLYYSYLQSHGLSNGVDTLVATAPGYVPDTAFVRVTTPRLYYAGGLPSNAASTNSPVTVTVYAADSLNGAHYTLDTVVVRVVSSDTTVIRPTSAFLKIPRGQYYGQHSIQYVGPGTASLTFTDTLGLYTSTVSNSVTVTGPTLVFSNTTARYGMRQRGSATDYYVYTQNNVASPVTVNLVSTDTRVATVPASITIPTGLYYAYFTITAQDTVGTIQVQASASGFGPPTPITVTVTQPKFVVSTSTNVRTTAGPQTITIYATDDNGNSHYVTENVVVSLGSSSGAVFTTDSTVATIIAGNYYTQAAKLLPVAVGSAQLTASDARAAIYKYNTATQNINVINPNLNLSWNSVVLGLGQYIDSNYDGSYYVTTSDNQSAPLSVALAHVGTARVTTLASVTVPTSSYYQYIRLTGAVRGTDTLVATAASPFHNPDTAYTVVDSGRVDGILSWPSTIAVGDSVLVTLRTLDPNASSVRRVAAATTFTLAPNASLQFRQAGATVTSVTVPVDGSQVQFYVKAVAAGSGTATITQANYKTYSPPAITVTP